MVSTLTAQTFSLFKRAKGKAFDFSQSPLLSYDEAVCSNAAVPSIYSTSDPATMKAPHSNRFPDNGRKLSVIHKASMDTFDGTIRALRSAHDLEQLSTTILIIESSIPSSSMRDCHRLRKFIKENSQPCSILATLAQLNC